MIKITKLTTCFTLLLFSFWAVISQASVTPENIFVLGSGSSESPWTQSVIQGLKQEIGGSENKQILYFEYLDAGRFDELGQQQAMFHYLETKFKKRKPDIFIAIGPAASAFSLEHKDLFADSQRILIEPRIRKHDLLTNEIIIRARVDYSMMVMDATRLSRPDKVYIIGDTVKPSDIHRISGIAGALKQQNTSYQLLENLPLAELLKKVSEVSRKSALFFTPIYREHEGKGYPPVQVLKKIHSISPAPIFATSVTELGFGAVGGYLHSPKELGIMAGEAVINVLNGLPLDFVHNGFELSYDWNELIRWGYQDKIEKNANIRFKPPGLWQEHKYEVIVFSTFFVVLSGALLVVIIYNRRLKSIQRILSLERRLLEKKVTERTKELTEMHQAAEKMARIDVLTSIYNRRAFFETGYNLHEQSLKTSDPYVIVMLDIDEFKSVNDTYGHATGDCVIQNVAKAVSSVSRKSDIVARIGGEEFAVIFINSCCEEIKKRAELIRTSVENTTTLYSGNKVRTTVSLGVAEFRPEDQDMGTVLARADAALYLAKEAGKNRVMYLPNTH